MKRRISKIVFFHYLKFISRIILFLSATIFYLQIKINNIEIDINEHKTLKLIVIIIEILFLIEMILRLFPSKIRSVGCQKHLKKVFNLKKRKNNIIIIKPYRTLLCALVWITGNMIFYVLYFFNIVDKGFMVLLCLTYSIGDVICILFYCPFQMWFLKNRCCVNCRIYNWDYAFLFTPLVVIPSVYTTPLVVFSLILLVVWEITLHIHPERFDENINASLSCENCTEKLCQYKIRLKKMMKETKKMN